jgi:hypothetical protein
MTRHSGKGASLIGGKVDFAREQASCMIKPRQLQFKPFNELT